MKPFVSRPLATAVAVAAAFPSFVFAQAASDSTLAPVVVTASRFANDPSFAPIGATVITAEDIRNAGVDNVNQAIRKIGGVYGRQSVFGSQDFELDLRGFGPNSSQNIVVMVDGVRLSENELMSAMLSSIAIDTVERIEIMRGGSSVLYGDGATGGVINVITKRPGKNTLRGSVSGEIGNFGHREARASVARGWENFALDANLSSQRADNYRENNDIKQQNFSGGAQWMTTQGRFGVRVEAARQDSRLAGGLSLAQFNQNPRQTLTPTSFGGIDTNRYTAFAERRFGAWDVAAELSHRDRESRFGADGGAVSTYKGKQTQFSPRVRNLRDFSGATNELVMGLDFIDWTRDVSSRYPLEHATQESKAAYFRDELKFGRARLAMGARHEVFDKKAVDPVATTSYSRSHSLNAWELQGGYDVTSVINVFAKAGRSFRVPNVDENSGTQVPDATLDPQTSRDLELGGRIGNAAHDVTVKLFRHQLRNEIFYDPTIHANVNLDPTRRQGIEVEAGTRIAATFRLAAQLQHVKATFTEGPNAGREMALVPKNTATVRLTWLPGNGQTADLGMQWVDKQRYGGDFSCASRIPSFTTVDGRYAKRFGAWELAVTGNNLTDKDYFSQAYRCEGSIYPSSGRQIKLSARYDF